MKQVLNYSIPILLLMGCGEARENAANSFDCMMYGEECPDAETRIGPQGQQGNSGIPQPTGNPIPGPAGEIGPQGPAGIDGENCTVNQTSQGAEITCPDGSGAVVLNGNTGASGSNGADGSSCSVNQMSNGATILCTDGTNAAILNGQDGEDAPATAYSIIEMKDPCGDQSGFDEVLLKTASGSWIAHFASGQSQFLTVLTPGTYITTDGSHCYFTLNANGTITGEHN
jgi:hypothetical protein